jgi:hypothetical protein
MTQARRNKYRYDIPKSAGAAPVSRGAEGRARTGADLVAGGSRGGDTRLALPVAFACRSRSRHEQALAFIWL